MAAASSRWRSARPMSMSPWSAGRPRPAATRSSTAMAGPSREVKAERLGDKGRCRCLMAVYYNDADPAACAWLRELIAAELLPAGEVDERSILEVEPADLRGFAQCHFFAGIGGWPYALRLAGVGQDLSVWTGSPPCQPFSQAGQRKGQDDDRHLAPAFLRLVAACRPELVFGEQVASAAVLGPVGGTARTAAEVRLAGRGSTLWRLTWKRHLTPSRRPICRLRASARRTSASGCSSAPSPGQPGGLGDSLGAGSQGRIGMPGGADQRAARPAGLAGGLADGDGGLARDGQRTTRPATPMRAAGR
ncbi:MAG: hypothetical protein KatS3mg118_3363 [Paracoccaceae bacterium]|nr:MAG: hypothetical protein KatS3mg118_3363 [Paracoccaceae bacterium]